MNNVELDREELSTIVIWRLCDMVRPLNLQAGLMLEKLTDFTDYAKNESN